MSVEPNLDLRDRERVLELAVEIVVAHVGAGLLRVLQEAIDESASAPRAELTVRVISPPEHTAARRHDKGMEAARHHIRHALVPCSGSSHRKGKSKAALARSDA